MATRNELRVQNELSLSQVHLADNFCKMSFTFESSHLGLYWRNGMESVASAGFYAVRTSGELSLRTHRPFGTQ